MMRYSNKSLLLYFAITILIANNSLIAQNKVLSSAEGEFDFAFGGGKYGLFVKANHQWTNRENLNFQSGISTALFLQSNSLSTDIYERKGVLFDPHLNINSGILYSVFKNKFQIGLDIYSGFYFVRRQGRYSSSILNFTQDRYLEQKQYFDWGTRLTLSYFFNKQIGLQLSANNSFNTWMVFRGADYSKMFFGIGIIYRPTPKE